MNFIYSKQKSYIKPIFFSLLLILMALTGCVSMSDLEELGFSLKREQESMEVKLKQQQEKDRQDSQSNIESLQIRLDGGFKQQEAKIEEKFKEQSLVQKEKMDVLQKKIQTDNQELKTVLKEELKTSTLTLLTRIEANLLEQKNLKNKIETMEMKLSSFKMAYDEETKKINFKLQEINESLNISRSVQDVQVSFGSIKNRLEDSYTRVESQELIIRQLDNQMHKTELNNLILAQDIRELEGRLNDLLAILEQRQQANSSQSEELDPISESQKASD